MGKKLMIFVFLAVCMIFFIVAGKYVHDAGLLRKYPKPTYFSEAEAESRPAYSQLSDREKALYHALYTGISEKKEKIALPYEVSGDTYTKIYCLVEKQEPSLFYADSTYYTAKKLRDAHIIYRDEEEKLPLLEKELETEVQKAVISVSGAKDDYTKALRIHDYIVNKCKYTLGEGQTYSSTAYGCIVEGSANCEGYAKAFMLLAARCGLKCVLVTGVTDEGENHAWNQVCVDGSWRNVDVTWDDIDVAGDKRRMYFLCGDAEFSRTHTADNTYFTPFDCSGAGSDYYIMNGTYAETLEEAEQIIARSVREHQTTVEIKFANSELYKEFRSSYLDNSRIFEVIVEASSVRSPNASLTVRENERESCITLVFSGI